MRDDPRNPIHNEDVRLREKRAWMNRHIEKAMRKRHYPGMFPEDDWPLWRKLIPEVVGVVVLVAFMFCAFLLSRWVGEVF